MAEGHGNFTTFSYQPVAGGIGGDSRYSSVRTVIISTLVLLNERPIYGASNVSLDLE